MTPSLNPLVNYTQKKANGSVWITLEDGACLFNIQTYDGETGAPLDLVAIPVNQDQLNRAAARSQKNLDDIQAVLDDIASL